MLITTTSRATRQSLEKQLDQAINRQTQINSKVDTLNEQLFNYETEIVEVSINNDIAGELGPLKYLSGLTGIPMDQIINYLLLTIIFVFDPLAIALVIAANFAFAKLIPKTRNNLYGEKVVVEEKDDDWDSTLNDGLEDEKDDFDWEAAEKRMDIIGQNGNEGEHYSEIEELEEKINNTSKANKYGARGWKNLTKKLQDLKKKDDRNDDLTIKY